MPVPRLTLQHPPHLDPRLHAGLLVGALAAWLIALAWARPWDHHDPLLEPWR